MVKRTTIVAVTHNNRKKGFQVETSAGAFWFPYSICDIEPTRSDPIRNLFVDRELDGEGFTYVLASGKTGSVLADWVHHYNREPGYLRDCILYDLTVEAQQRVTSSRLSRRELIRRLGTSGTQFYRLLDQINYRKSIDQMLRLLAVLDWEVEVTVRSKTSGYSRSRDAASR